MLILKYLTNRVCKYTVNSHTSEDICSEIGLPQGGIIVCLLFIFYIADITSNPIKLKTPTAIFQQPKQKSPEICIPEQTHGSSRNRTAAQKKTAKKGAIDKIHKLPHGQPIFFKDGSFLRNPGPCGAGIIY